MNSDFYKKYQMHLVQRQEKKAELDKKQEELNQVKSEYSALKEKYEQLNQKAKDNAKLERSLVQKMPGTSTKLYAEALLYGEDDSTQTPSNVIIVDGQKIVYTKKHHEPVEGVTFVDQSESLNVQLNDDEEDSEESDEKEATATAENTDAVTDYVDPKDAKNLHIDTGMPQQSTF